MLFKREDILAKLYQHHPWMNQQGFRSFLDESLALGVPCKVVIAVVDAFEKGVDTDHSVARVVGTSAWTVKQVLNLAEKHDILNYEQKKELDSILQVATAQTCSAISILKNYPNVVVTRASDKTGTVYRITGMPLKTRDATIALETSGWKLVDKSITDEVQIFKFTKDTESFTLKWFKSGDLLGFC